MQLGISKEFEKSIGFENLEKELITLLKEEGFGVLTEIDVHAVMLKKGQDWDLPYKILGACKPPFANKVLKADPEIGVMLPCNVLIYETTEGKLRVSMVNANGMFELIANEQVKDIANMVSTSFNSILAKLDDKYN